MGLKVGGSINKKSIRKYVYYEYTRPDGQRFTGEMNWWEWERLQRDTHRSRMYTLLRVVDLQPGAPTQAMPMPTTLPPVVEDHLECPLCGAVAKDDADLKAHKAEAHGPKPTTGPSATTTPGYGTVTVDIPPVGATPEADTVHRELSAEIGGGTGDSQRPRARGIRGRQNTRVNGDAGKGGESGAKK